MFYGKLNASFCPFKRIAGFWFPVQLLYFYCLTYTKWAADGFKAVAELSSFEQRRSGNLCRCCIGGKPEARHKPAKWSSAAWGQHWSHLEERLPVHGLTALRLSVPLEGSPFVLWNSWWPLLFTTQPYNAFVPFRFVITDGESYVMEEFKIVHKVECMYSLQWGLIIFEVWKQKLKESCQWPPNMED